MEGSLSSSIPKPNDDENEEYQKIFSIICGSNIIENDTISNIQYLNGNGLFTCNNVTAFVQKITHNFMITNQNVMPVMPLLDINYNGMISWESFIGALNQWISHSLCFEGLYRRKIGLTMGSRERQIFHHTIANFFLLSGKGLNNTIPKLNSVLELTGSKFDFQLIDLFQDRKVDKAASFKDASDLLQNFDLITKQIASASTILEGIQILNNALRFISRAQSPIELYLSSKLISKLLNFMLNAGIFDQIIVTIVREEDATLQWESLKALSYMVACLKLKDENFDGPQFAQIEQVRNYLFNPEFLNVLWKLAYSTCIEIKEQSLICMGFIAQLNEDSRNYMIVSLQVVSNLSACLSGDRTERYFEAVSFVLSTLAGLLPTNFSLMMDMSVVFAFIEAGYKLITLRDNISILRDGFEILSITLPLVEYSTENKIILERIMQIILQHPNVIVKKFAFATVKEIVEQRESQTKHLLDDKLLVVLNDILTSNEHTLKFLCCRILHILAKKGHSLALFDSKTIPVITKRISDTPQCRWECIKILKTMVSQPSFTSVLVENGVIKLIFSVLSGVREQDDILAEAYNYQGLYLNLPYLIDCINALNTILMNGNISKTGSNLNVYVDHFDKENIERLQLVLEGLFEDKLEVKSQMNRSYLKNYSETSLDQLLMTFLANIRNAHKARDGDLSRSIVSQVSSLLCKLICHTKCFTNIVVVGTNFQEILSTESNPRQAGGSHDIFGDTYLEVRCFSAEEFPNGDNRVISIPRVIGFSQFIGEIQKKYKQFGAVMIKYFDKAGEILTIDSDEMFQKVLAETLENILNYGPSSDKRLLRVVVKFEDGFANRTEQPKEMQCFECGKKFEVLALYENSDPDELFICYNCKLEQGQMPMPMPMPIGHMTPSPQAGLSRSPYPYPYKF